MAGWQQDDIDAATDGPLAHRRPNRSLARVVGVVRALDDMQPRTRATGTGRPGRATYTPARPGTRPMGNDLAGYGAGVVARLVDGPASLDDFNAVLDQMPNGGSVRAKCWWRPVLVDSLERSTRRRTYSALRFRVAARRRCWSWDSLSHRSAPVAPDETRREPEALAIGFTRRDLVVTSALRALHDCGTRKPWWRWPQRSPCRHARGRSVLARKVEFSHGVRRRRDSS
jgi:hypothetical protein